MIVDSCALVPIAAFVSQQFYHVCHAAMLQIETEQTAEKCGGVEQKEEQAEKCGGLEKHADEWWMVQRSE